MVLKTKILHKVEMTDPGHPTNSVSNVAYADSQKQQKLNVINYKVETNELSYIPYRL